MGKFHFWVTFLGAYVIFFPMHYLGLLGVPRRYHEIGETAFIPESAATLNAFISVMALIVGVAQMVFLFNLVWSLRQRQASRRQSLERDLAGMADAGDAAGARQLGQGAAGRLPLGLRLQRAGRRARTSSRRTSRRRRARRPGRTHDLHPAVHRRRWRRSSAGGCSGRGSRRSRGWRPARRGRSPDDGRLAAADGEDRARRLPRRRRLAVRAPRQRLRHAHGTWRTGGPLPQPGLLWVNTGVLVASSVALHRAQVAARRRRARGHPVLACWPAASPPRLPRRAGPRLAAARRGGLPHDDQPGRRVLLPDHRGARAARAGRPGRAGAGPAASCGAACGMEALRLSVELCATYWHFLLGGLDRPVRPARVLAVHRVALRDLHRLIRIGTAHAGHRAETRDGSGHRCPPAGWRPSSPTGRPTSARSRTCPGGRP